MKSAYYTLKVFFIIYYINTQNFGAAFVTENCTTSDGKPGKCMLPYLCSSKLPQDIIVPKISFSKIHGSICSFGYLSILICCPLENYKVSKSAYGDSQDKSQFHNTAVKKNHNYNKKSHSSKWIHDNDVPAFPKSFYPPLCGRSNSAHDRVVGGSESELGSWPWIASLGYNIDNKPKDDEFFCGATLISSKHLVTAAHCVEEKEHGFIIRLGDKDLESSNDGAHPINVLVKRAFPHPKYNRTSKENDIAVLTLNEDVVFTDLIRPICLPLSDDIRNYNFTRAFPFVAGWGATYYGGPPSSVLRETQVPVLDNSKCDEAYSSKNVIVDDRSLCAGYLKGGKDACQGDSGGPLMFPRNMSFYLIGVVSTGFQCAAAGFPGLYTRVSEFLNFIYNNMA